MIPLDRLSLADKFLAMQRTLFGMDGMSRFQYAIAGSLLLHALVLFGITIRPPDLSKLGYSLAAVRRGEAAVVLDYRGERGRVFTLYLRRSSGEERFEMTRRGDLRICVWQDEALSAVMFGEMSAGEMLRLATLAYAGLSA